MKRSVPEGFLAGEARAGKESRRVAELNKPRDESGEHTAEQKKKRPMHDSIGRFFTSHSRFIFRKFFVRSYQMTTKSMENDCNM